MPIAGAIFDFDGTIVDSMPMWERVPMELVARHGKVLTHETFMQIESLSANEKCDWFHEHLGAGESGEALFQEQRAMVRHEYETSIKAFPGVHEFLQGLSQAGIPMVIASSTPVEDVRLGLRAQGLEGYFQDIIFAADIGRGKEFPDVYLYALKCLGTPLEATWVFEDAPFGVRTAHEAGFPVVAVLNDHDGRDEAFLRENCDILAHGYEELSLALIEDYAKASASDEAWGERTLRTLIVDGSPEPSSVDLVQRLTKEADYIVAADRGAELLYAVGVEPDVFCGDADSVSGEVAAWAHASARTDIRFPSEKYATDLALAIDCARHEAARRDARLSLTITCASGGRPDHQLAVYGRLASCENMAARIVEDSYECRVLSPRGEQSWLVGSEEGALGATLSAIALREGTVISERGLKWELDHKKMEVLGDLGISNIVMSASAEIICHEGVVAVFLLR